MTKCDGRESDRVGPALESYGLLLARYMLARAAAQHWHSRCLSMRSAVTAVPPKVPEAKMLHL